MKISTPRALALFAIIVASAAMEARAVTASADIEATAGILPLLTLECTPINFGVWRIPLRSTGGETIVILPSSYGAPATLGGNAANVSASSTSGHIATQGVCTLSGSSAPDATVVNVNGVSTIVEFEGSSTAYAGIGASASAGSIPLYAGLYPVGGVTTMAGSSTFYVGGELTIPEVITSDYYGGYKSISPFVIVADDGM